MMVSEDPATLLQAGRHEEARAACRRLLADDPADAVARHMMGVACAVGGTVPEAVAWTRGAALVDPTNGAYQAGLGRLEAALGRLGPALSATGRAVRLRPEDARLWRQLAELRLVAEDLDGVVGLAAEMPAAVADHVEAVRALETAARGQRADRRRATGDLEGAAADLRAVVAVAPQEVEARINLAGVLCALERRHAAEGHARAALRLDRDSAGAWVNLAGALDGQARLRDAHEALRHAAVRAPAQPQAWMAFAQLRDADAPGAGTPGAHQGGGRVDAAVSPAVRRAALCAALDPAQR